jgi:RecA/RadA recombinase
MPAKKLTKKESTVFGLDTPDYASQIRESMTTLASKRKSASGAMTASEIRREYLRMDPLYLQYILGAIGVEHGKFIEIIGGDAVGKSSLVMTILGMGMAQGCPAFYIETENKPLTEDRMLRCLHTNPEIAAKLMDNLFIQFCDDISESISIFEDFVGTVRSNGLPMHIPIIVALDSFSKLMSPDEAVGRSIYGSLDKKGELTTKKKIESVGANKVNFGHAKLAQQWCRLLPSWQRKNNVIVLVVSHQNDDTKGAEGGMGGAMMMGATNELYNRTKIGGKAFNQNAVLQLMLKRGRFSKHRDQKVGHIIDGLVYKYSHGVDKRTFSYESVTEPYLDREGYQQPPIYFGHEQAKFMAEKKLLGVKCERQRYTCPSLDLMNVESHELFEAMCDPANSEIIEELGRELKLKGYEIK